MDRTVETAATLDLNVWYVVYIKGVPRWRPQNAKEKGKNTKNKAKLDLFRNDFPKKNSKQNKKARSGANRTCMILSFEFGVTRGSVSY